MAKSFKLILFWGSEYEFCNGELWYHLGIYTSLKEEVQKLFGAFLPNVDLLPSFKSDVT